MADNTAATHAEQVQRALTHQINYTQKKIRALTRAVAKVDDFEELQVAGTLLKTYASQIQGHPETVSLPDYRTQGKSFGIHLDPSKSVMANAEDYFHRYRKAKRGLDTVEGNLHAAEAELTHEQELLAGFNPADDAAVENLYVHLRAADIIKVHAPKHVVEPAHPHRFYTSDGVLVEVGKNSRQNDELTLNARKDYYWMHVRDLPGSHVVIHSANPSQKTLTEAAILTAYYSKARGNRRVPVDLLRVSQMSKPKGAKPGLVTFSGKAKTIAADAEADLVAQIRQED